MMLVYAATVATTANDTWSRADIIALAALAAAFIGVAVAWRTLWCSNLNVSVATAGALMADIQTSLNEYIGSIPDSQPNEKQQSLMAEKLEVLMNRLEMASAVCVERSLYGISLTLIRSYVKDVLKLIVKNQYVCSEARKLLQDEATFKYIRWFMDIAPKGSITDTDGWYVRYEPGFIERLRVKLGLAG
jgi:hypothetical protein